ncbi:MAG TPA: hypothetical protein VIJ85_10220 [Rhizomicrobium sp.]
MSTVRDITVRFLGTLGSEKTIRAEVAKLAKARDVHTMRGTMDSYLTHITGKSGALLQAQGIFIVVATYLLQPGWPRFLALASIVMLTMAAMAVMTNLRSVFIGRNVENGDSDQMELEIVVQMALLTARRGLLFNIALYLTFVSVFLLGVAAMRFV